jgi:Tfp pilus assembly protein PilZ
MLNKIFPVSIKKLPIPIVVIGIFYLLTPIFSYLATAYSEGIPFWQTTELIKTFSLRSIILNVLGVILGFGIIGVKRWGYFLFLLFNFILILHGIYLLITIGLTKSFVWNLFITLLPFFLNLYFLNREISTPYLTLIPRGFRKKWRIEIPLIGKITLKDTKHSFQIKTMDISPSGTLVHLDQILLPETIVEVSLELEKPWTCDAELVRITEGNYGFKFLYLPTDPRYKELDKYLTTKLLPRFTTKRPIKINYKNKEENSDIINISEKGLFFTTQSKFTKGEEINFQFSLLGIHFSGPAKVSWENTDGNFDKPKGYGIAFKELQNNTFYQLIFYIYSLSHSVKMRDR